MKYSIVQTGKLRHKAVMGFAQDHKVILWQRQEYKAELKYRTLLKLTAKFPLASMEPGFCSRVPDLALLFW